MLEIGKPGSAGTDRGERPVLQDGEVVATLQASNWRESATAAVGRQAWVFTRQGRSTVGRWAAEPEDTARLRARQTGWWKGTWVLDLEGTTVELEVTSHWKGTHRYLIDGRTVAESGSTGGWSPRPTLTAESELPLHHQMFMLWLELVLQRRNTAAAAA